MRLKNNISGVKGFLHRKWKKVSSFLPTRVYYKQSLFIKYLSVSLIIVFLSFLTLGVILTLVLSNYWTNQQIIELEQKTQSLAEYTVKRFSLRTVGGGKNITLSVADPVSFQEAIDAMATTDNLDIIILDYDGKVKSTSFSSGERTIHANSFTRNSVVKQSHETGKFSSKGTLDGFYKSDRYIVALPLYFRQNENDVGKYPLEINAGAIIVSTDNDSMSNITEMVSRWFILSAVVALSFSILAISIFSYNMVKPLKQMAQAAKQFGKGDFSVRVNESTNDEIGELAVSFNNMAESLSSSEITRKSFIANVSHELKTPMTTISGFIDGILDGTIPAEKHSYYLNIVSNEVKRLSRLVHSMLNLSRIDNGELKVNFQNFDLFNTLVTIVITFEQEIDKKNIEIRGLDSINPVNVYGDKDLLHQVIYNLIENAVKFTDENGYIEFEIEEHSSRVIFRVKNSGQGIKKSEIPLVFDRFYKTDKSRSKDKKGLGLGLYLVRSIIRKHGGEINAQSEYGEYTQFEFYIPKKQEKKMNNP